MLLLRDSDSSYQRRCYLAYLLSIFTCASTQFRLSSLVSDDLGTKV